MKKLSFSEQLAEKVVSTHLTDVTVTQSDFNTGQPRHDFELARDGVPFAAMEVTEDREEAEAQWTALGEPLLSVPGCTVGWRVVLERAPRFPNRWADQFLSRFLQALEEGGTGHSIYADSPSNLPVPPEMHELGYVAAVEEPSVPAGSVRLDREGWDRIASSDEVADWVTDFINSDRCSGERAKLGSSGFDERHLAIVVPFSPATGRRIFNLMMSGVEEFGFPNRLPEFPSEITHVWLVCDYPDVRSLMVSHQGWRATEPATPLTS